MLLSGCRNITAQDFDSNDMANILKVIMSPEEQTEETAGSIDLSVNLTEQNVTVSETDQIRTDGSEIIRLTEVPEMTETDETGEAYAPDAQITENAAETYTTEYNDDIRNDADTAAVVDIHAVFPDAPEKFKDVPFPQSLRMTDFLKKNIKSLANFSSKDFSAMSFYIATTDAKLFTPIYGGGMLSDARRYRTDIVDAECNTAIMSIEKPKESILHDIKTSVQADEFVSDIICVPFDVQSELVREGLLMNLKKIPFLNLTAEYYEPSATEAFTINGNIYGLVSDLTFDPSAVYAMFYNKNLVKEYNLSSPAEAYKNGVWNYDSMFAVSKEFTAAVSDLNGDTAAGAAYSIGVDRENKNILNGFFVSAGGKYFTKKDYAFPILNFNNEKTLKLIDAVSKIFSPSEESGMVNFLDAGEPVQTEAFINGNVLFSISKLSVIPDITDADFGWGILPVPALNENGESASAGDRRSFTDNSALCIAVPKGTRNTEACGIVANALSLTSYKQLKDIYVSEQMTYHLRDVDSVKVLGDIINNITFNQYNAFSTIPEIYGSTVGILDIAVNKKGDFLTSYDSGKKVLNEFFKNSKIFERS